MSYEEMPFKISGEVPDMSDGGSEVFGSGVVAEGEAVEKPGRGVNIGRVKGQEVVENRINKFLTGRLGNVALKAA